MVRRVHTRLAILTVAIIAVSMPMVGVPTAWADDAIMSQEYVSVTGLDQLKAEGLDGTGVTIAVIDGNVDLTVPELTGADIDVKASCTSKGAAHGTGVLSILADPIWGWAPKAHFLEYVPDGLFDPTGRDETTSGCEGVTDDMVQRAINDGADIINLSGSLVLDEYTIVRAAMRGIPIVAASGNYGEFGTDVQSPRNTVVTVGATDMTGTRSSYSQYGEGLTIMAPADPMTLRDPDSQGNLTVVTTGIGGTSSATPMVTGALALAMQKWPDANGNQLIASLIATANRTGTGWDQYYGWGTFNPTALISNDPSQYPTDNPLMHAVPDGYPTQQQYNNYVNGTLEFPPSPLDQDYTPASGSATSESSPDQSSSPIQPSPDTGVGWVIPVSVGIGVVVVAAIVIVILLSRRRRTTPAQQAPQPSSPYPVNAPSVSGQQAPPASYPASPYISAPGPYPAQQGPYPQQGWPPAQPSPQPPYPPQGPPPGWAPPPAQPYPPQGSQPYPPQGPHA